MRHQLTGTTLLWLGMAALVPAQEQTASIAGVVRDMNGGAIAGASVLAANDDGLAVPAVTDGSGRFRFPSLPPGEFALTAHQTGFAPARVERVGLRLGQQMDVPITLEAAALSESIRVVAETPTIAITQSARTTSLRQESIEKLPNGREFTDVVNQVAGANIEVNRYTGNISIDGASGAENRFIIDGAESTDTIFGTATHFSQRAIVTDFMEEIQVKSSGYTAEYGGATGGVVNALSRSGSNAWHGSALLYWEADWLDADPRPSVQLNRADNSVVETVTYAKDGYHGVEPGFTLGGPILRDTLWFFAGYIPRFEPVERTAPFTDGSTGTLRQNRKYHNATVNLTGQLGSRWRFRTGFSAGRTRIEGFLQNRNGSSPPDGNFDEVDIYPSWSLSGSVDWVPSHRYYMSFRAGYSFRDRTNEGVYEGDLLIWRSSSEGLPGVPPEFQQPRGFRNAPSNRLSERSKQGRLALQWDTTLFFDAAGRHQLKGGVQIDRISLDTLRGDAGNEHFLHWDRSFAGQRGAYGYYQVWSNPIDTNRGVLTIPEGTNTNLGLFVQDSWTVTNRLTLNLGLRVENEHVPSFALDPAISQTAVRWGFGDKLAPRLGFAWDVTGDGRTKLYGSWGVFYDIMKSRASAGFGAQYLTWYWYTLDDPDISGIENNPDCPPACPGDLIFGPIDILDGSPLNDPEDLKMDPDLRPMKLQEAVLGVERDLGNDLSVSLRYIHKQVDQGVERMTLRDEDGMDTLGLGNPGFGVASTFLPQGTTTPIPLPEVRRDYDAVEVGLNKRMSKGWAGRFVYLWSRLHGNYPGVTSSDFFTIDPNFNPNFDFPFMSFDEDAQPVFGPLSTDRPHQIKAQLVYDFRFGTTVGASWFGASGVPRRRIASFVPGFGVEVFYQGRESDGRMPFTTRLDLQLQHRFRLGDVKSLTLIATIFNLFDQDKPVEYFEYELFGGQSIDIAEADFFQGFDTQQLIDEQGLVRDPRFLMDRLFQQPRSIRFGVRFSFSKRYAPVVSSGDRVEDRGSGVGTGQAGA